MNNEHTQHHGGSPLLALDGQNSVYQQAQDRGRPLCPTDGVLCQPPVLGGDQCRQETRKL